MVNPTTRPHRTLKSHPQSRCTPRRCGATGWSPRRCPQRPSSPAPAALPPCGAGSLLGRRQRRGSFNGFGHTEIPKAAVPLMKSSEQDSPYSASKYWTRYGITVMVNDSQDRLGGQVEWELNVSALLRRVTPLSFSPLCKLGSGTAVSKEQAEAHSHEAIIWLGRQGDSKKPPTAGQPQPRSWGSSPRSRPAHGGHSTGCGASWS